MELCLECWQDLESERSTEWINLGNKVVRHNGAIPFRALDVWARRKRLDDQTFTLVKTVITYLDTCRAEREASDRSLKGS